MLATFTIEILFALYIVWRYQMNTISRLVVAILGSLAVFQGAEYMICGGLGINPGTWSRLGYGAITLLPPLGLHLVYAIAGKQSKFLVPASYITAGAFLTYFVFISGSITGSTCYANYAVFDTAAASSKLYGLYYYGWMLTAAALSFRWAQSSKDNIKRALYAFCAGYGAFIVPTTAINLIDPSTIAAIPSIMCGFAVILAFILVGKVAPEAGIPRGDKSLLERAKLRL